MYCSYCERRIPTLLAVEHIQPKGLAQYAHLEGRWENFLLACTNCNSTKGDDDVLLHDVVLPDRDNTFVAFVYSPDGTVQPNPGSGVEALAAKTLALVGLDRPIATYTDANGKEVALDRVRQRLDTWAEAQEVKSEVDLNPGVDAVRRLAVRTALGKGFFSIWMTVFQSDSDMRDRLINAFSGTRGSGCFDPKTTAPISPAPNPDGLPNGSKI